MHFTSSKEKLAEAISIVSRAITGKTTKPILESIFIEVSDNSFKLMGNNLELGIETAPIECNATEEGTLCIDAKLFSEIVRLLPEDDVLVKTKDNNVMIIKSGKSEFKILGLSSEDFPLLPIVDRRKFITLPAGKLKNLIRQTIFSVSTDESKPILTGILFDVKDENLNVVAVDGFRIAICRNESGYEGDDFSIVIPSKTLNEISKILPTDENSNVNIFFTDKHILFEMKSGIVVSRLIEGEFMNYNQIFSDDYNTTITVNKNKFISCLERSSIISKESNKNPVKLKIENEILYVTSNNELGNTYEELGIDMDGDSIEIAFNPRYLIDALKVIDDEETVIQFTTSLSPCIIRPIESEHYKYLIVPLRLRS